jgi:hypothetical protein
VSVGTLRRSRIPDGTRLQLEPIPAWSWTLIAIAAVVLTAGVITTWLLIIAGHAAAGTSRASAQLDAVRTGLAAGGGAGAAVGLMLAFRRQHHQEIATQNTDFDATERRITELYTKAVEQLGSDKAPVRFGGLYALERLAQDNPGQRQTIVNVICAYLRMPFTETPTRPAARTPESISTEIENTVTSQIDEDTWQQEKEVRVTAQRILSVHLKRPTSQDPTDTSPSRFWPNDIKLIGDRHQPENNPGQRGQLGGLAGFPGLVPAARPLGLALVASAWALGHEVAGEGDLEGQIGGEAIEVLRGKSIRSR